MEPSALNAATPPADDWSNSCTDAIEPVVVHEIVITEPGFTILFAG
jgi:hypothetical protein